MEGGKMHIGHFGFVKVLRDRILSYEVRSCSNSVALWERLY